jgi:hypothetical protein
MIFETVNTVEDNFQSSIEFQTIHTYTDERKAQAIDYQCFSESTSIPISIHWLVGDW